MEDIVKRTIEYITTIFRDNADGHDLEHSLRVYRNAMILAESYPEADKRIVYLAALLHDVAKPVCFTEEELFGRRWSGLGYDR